MSCSGLVFDPSLFTTLFYPNSFQSLLFAIYSAFHYLKNMSIWDLRLKFLLKQCAVNSGGLHWILLIISTVDFLFPL